MSVCLSVMTFNLHDDDQQQESPNSWEKRRDLCLSVITSYSPIILCTQQGSIMMKLAFNIQSVLLFEDFCFACIWLTMLLASLFLLTIQIVDLCYFFFSLLFNGFLVISFCFYCQSDFSSLMSSSALGVKTQLDFLQQGLPGYDQFGISRKGPQDTSDEHCTIFYDKEKVELLEGGTFWLSESPSVPGSMSWGSEYPCIATWATFQLKGVEPPGFSFQIVNTNMDEYSSRARRKSALLTWQHIASLPPSLSVVYCGGFNTQKESTTGRFLLGRSREHGVVGDMWDAWPCAHVRKNVSLIRTYHGFKGNKQGALEFLELIFRALCLCWDRQTQDLHIDWVLFRGRSLIPASCEVVNDNFDGYYPSSHYPIFAEFMLPSTVRMPEPPVQQDN